MISTSKLNPSHIIHYQVESCGTTLEITTNKATAVDCYIKSAAPEVKLLALDINGNLHTLQRKTYGFSGHSKTKAIAIPTNDQ